MTTHQESWTEINRLRDVARDAGEPWNAPQEWRALQDAMAEEMADVHEVTRMLQCGELVCNEGESVGDVLNRWRRDKEAVA